jgi:hypothetical protein
MGGSYIIPHHSTQFLADQELRTEVEEQEQSQVLVALQLVVQVPQA